MILYVALLRGEAIEEPVATRGDQIWLGATARRVGRMPGVGGRRIRLHILGTSHWRITRAISVSEHCDAGTAANPVLTGKIHVRGKGTAVLVGAGQDVVHVGRVAPHFDWLALFVESIVLVDLVVVAVEISDVRCDSNTFGVLPWTIPDTVTRINCVRAAASICAEVGTPRLVAHASSLCQRLTMRICTGQSTEICTLAWAGAGYKEGHVGLLRLGASGQTKR